MRGRAALLITGLAIAGVVSTSTSAVARPIDKGHFDDVFTSDVYDCDGTPAEDPSTSPPISSSTSEAPPPSLTTGRACTVP